MYRIVATWLIVGLHISEAGEVCGISSERRQRVGPEASARAEGAPRRPLALALAGPRPRQQQQRRLEETEVPHYVQLHRPTTDSLPRFRLTRTIRVLITGINDSLTCLKHGCVKI